MRLLAGYAHMSSGITCGGQISKFYSNTYTHFTEGMNTSLYKPQDWFEARDSWACLLVTNPALSR